MSTEGALSFGRTQLPDEQRRALTRAIHLEWVTIAFMTTAVAVVYLAMGSSHASRTYQPRDAGRGLRDVARQTLAADSGLELLIYGHSHVAALERMPSGNIYANAGSWLDAPTYLLVTPERIALREWRGSTDGPDLHAFDRVAEKALP